MIVVVIAELKVFKSQAAEFFLFAALMLADMMIFILLAMRYKYVTESKQRDDNKVATVAGDGAEPKETAFNTIDLKNSQKGVENEAYTEENAI